MTPSAPHIPVLRSEMLAYLAPQAGGCYVDGTFGAGGYSRAILDVAEGCTVIAIDRDPEAAPRAIAVAAEYPQRLVFLAGCFGDMAHLLAANDLGPVDGVVLDIGVSSPQIDTPERGFSFRADGPLDMRMGKSGPSAADVVNTYEEETLADILWRYGEERMSRRIARALVRSRETEGPITTTGRLASLVRSVVRKAKDGIDPATRTFQGLRIHVNDELGELERGLAAAESILAPGGRLVVVSFHSLEDRLVKTFLKERCGEGDRPSRRLPGEPVPPAPTFSLLTRRAVFAGPEECAANPRSRSARLRAATRTTAPALSSSPAGGVA